jgi:hypothetical protein
MGFPNQIASWVLPEPAWVTNALMRSSPRSADCGTQGSHLILPVRSAGSTLGGGFGEAHTARMEVARRARIRDSAVGSGRGTMDPNATRTAGLSFGEESQSARSAGIGPVSMGAVGPKSITSGQGRMSSARCWFSRMPMPAVIRIKDGGASGYASDSASLAAARALDRALSCRNWSGRVTRWTSGKSRFRPLDSAVDANPKDLGIPGPCRATAGG